MLMKRLKTLICYSVAGTVMLLLASSHAAAGALPQVKSFPQGPIVVKRKTTLQEVPLLSDQLELARKLMCDNFYRSVHLFNAIATVGGKTMELDIDTLAYDGTVTCVGQLRGLFDDGGSLKGPLAALMMGCGTVESTSDPNPGPCYRPRLNSVSGWDFGGLTAVEVFHSTDAINFLNTVIANHKSGSPSNFFNASSEVPICVFHFAEHPLSEIINNCSP